MSQSTTEPQTGQQGAGQQAASAGGNQGAAGATTGQGQQGEPQRPDTVTEQEWASLGEAGKTALNRERERAEAAERALAASRARPGPAGGQQNTQPTAATGGSQSAATGGQASVGQAATSGQASTDTPDIAAIIKQAVSEAVQPFQEAEQRRTTEAAVERVRQTVIDAAKPRLHDATDALAGIDLASVVNDQGAADPEKVKSALDDLVTRKPHLAKTTVRTAPPGIGGGAPAGATEAEKVKSALADMQRATGVRPPAVPSTTT